MVLCGPVHHPVFARLLHPLWELLLDYWLTSQDIRSLTDENVPIDIAARVREQVHGGIGNIFYATPTSKRDFRRNVFGSITLGSQTVHSFSLPNGSWCDYIRGEAQRTEFDGQIV